MPSDRTFVTEVSTGLGMLGEADIATVLQHRPPQFGLGTAEWERLARLWSARAFDGEFVSAFTNGRAFLHAPDGLNGRQPRIVEWTGGRRPPGDEVVPSDLRVDHVYLVSCKYLSRILHNPSPARLFEGLLGQRPVDDGRDWYERVAPEEYQALYECCGEQAPHLPARVGALSAAERRELASWLAAGWPPGAAAAYQRLCNAVAAASAELWSCALARSSAEAMMWRLLRIGSAPYFVLGTSPTGPMRLRIATPWDWRRQYRFRRLEVSPQLGGQPRVRWSVHYQACGSAEPRVVRGHVEIRWSHGRFAQPPEAKVYLDTRHEGVPGYYPL